MSNVPSLTIDGTGVTLPAEQDILSGVQADINEAFGGGVNPGLSTPQGQIAQSMTAIIGDKNAQFAELVSNVDPDTASGRWQDAIARIYFLERIPASGSVVIGKCTGAVGTLIPAGTRAQDTNGYVYASTADGTIGSEGFAEIQFQNTTTGPIGCAVGALSTIYTAVIGWDRIENESEAVLGTNVESRADFEYRRSNSVALNATGSLPAIYANVLAVDGVLDAYVTENPTSSTVTKGSTSYSLLPHSIYVAAVGGAASDIAQAIWTRKNTGADYNGNTTVTVTDSDGYEPPYPSYQVKFEIPSDLPIYFAVEIEDSPDLPADVVAQVKTAIVSAFNGLDGGARARIGSRILASRFYAPVQAVSTAVEVLSILIGTTSSPALNSLTVGIDQVPTISAANISVTLVS